MLVGYALRASESGCKRTRADNNVGYRKQTKSQKSALVISKSRYQKVIHILSKIARNMAAGTVHKQDEKVLTKY